MEISCGFGPSGVDDEKAMYMARIKQKDENVFLFTIVMKYLERFCLLKIPEEK